MRVERRGSVKTGGTGSTGTFTGITGELVTVVRFTGSGDRECGGFRKF